MKSWTSLGYILSVVGFEFQIQTHFLFSNLIPRFSSRAESVEWTEPLPGDHVLEIQFFDTCIRNPIFASKCAQLNSLFGDHVEREF
jgi:hypothetical protein